MKRPCLSRLILWALSVWLAIPVVVMPQEPAESAPSDDRSDSDSPVRVAGPDTYLLKDRDGKLIKVPGFTFEDFQRLYKLERRFIEPDLPPRYSMSKLEIQGLATADRATLDVQVHVHLNHERWVRVPLGLHDTVLRGEVRYDGQGEHFLHYDEQRDGYVIWLRGATDRLHVVGIQVVEGIDHVGAESRITLALPRANESQLRLIVPATAAVAKVSKKTAIVETAPAEGKGSLLTVNGLGRWQMLSWREGQTPAVRDPTVLEVTGKVLARIEAPTRIRYSARLRVRSFGGATERLRVRLPYGAELIPRDQPGYVVVPVNVEATADPDDRQVEIRFNEEFTAPLPEVQLVAESSPKLTSTGQYVELAGFEVIGAARQSGYFALAVVGDYYPDWEEGINIQRVNQLPEEFRDEPVVASFEYFGQPYSMKVAVQQRELRVAVEPFYTVQVAPDRVDLEARLDCSIRGAQASFLDVDLQDWTIDEVGPKNLVKNSEMVLDHVGPLIIPLKSAAMGKFQITIRGHKRLKDESTRWSLRMPRPDVSTLRPAMVAIVPDDNVELIPRPDEIEGLIPEQFPPSVKLPVRQQEPFTFRDSGDAAPSTFSADFVIRPQVVTTEVSSRALLHEDGARVRQRIAYHIEHEPLVRLQLAMPAALAGTNQIDVTQGENRLTLVPTVSPDAREQTGGLVQMQVVLPTPQIGMCEIIASYPLSWRTNAASTPAPVTLGLIMPIDGNVTTNSLQLEAPAFENLALDDPAPWVPRENPVDLVAAGPTMSLFSEQSATTLNLLLTRSPSVRRGSTTVNQAWLQTWFSKDRRYDRATFELVTGEAAVCILAPAGASREVIRVRLNGEPVEHRIASAASLGPLMIEIPIETRLDRYLVELWYWFENGRQRESEISINFPVVAGATWTREQLWQLVLPRDEHLFHSPSELAPEFRWNWYELFWGRSQSFTPQLERLMGTLPSAKGSEGIPEVSTNQYLFRMIDSPGGIVIRTISRRVIILAVSGSVLLCGLLFIQVPLLRRPIVPLVGAVALATLGLLYPEPALLVAQATGLGLMLLLAGWLTRWVLVERSRDIGVVHGSSSSVVEKMSTAKIDRIAVEDLLPTTMNAPAANRGSQEEMKS